MKTVTFGIPAWLLEKTEEVIFMTWQVEVEVGSEQYQWSMTVVTEQLVTGY